ncbi:hypothetical protein CYMTET_29618 [Cymbomonas tetramitiformis]|uniref:Uncharacterized protein n=1 Tax=Cymbomonas tetramitiformis TaxID=36881 RepID=A0AAE0FKL7_9CHLO|nr:hypothetical protein CYMTET_29618 [Cymbomonas tetramitiformis]
MPLPEPKPALKSILKRKSVSVEPLAPAASRALPAPIVPNKQEVTTEDKEVTADLLADGIPWWYWALLALLGSLLLMLLAILLWLISQPHLHPITVLALDAPPPPPIAAPAPAHALVPSTPLPPPPPPRPSTLPEDFRAAHGRLFYNVQGQELRPSLTVQLALDGPGVIWYAVVEEGEAAPTEDELRHAVDLDRNYSACGYAIVPPQAVHAVNLSVNGNLHAETPQSCIDLNIAGGSKCSSCPLVKPDTNYAAYFLLNGISTICAMTPPAPPPPLQARLAKAGGKAPGAIQASQVVTAASATFNTPADTTAPAFYSGYPTIERVCNGTLEVLVQLAEPGVARGGNGVSGVEAGQLCAA